MAAGTIPKSGPGVYYDSRRPSADTNGSNAQRSAHAHNAAALCVVGGGGREDHGTRHANSGICAAEPTGNGGANLRAVQQQPLPGAVSERETSRVRSVRGADTSPTRLPARDSPQTPVLKDANTDLTAHIRPGPINISLLNHLLSSHPDRTLCDTVVQRFRTGADIGFKGPFQSQLCPGNLSARRNAAAESRAIRVAVDRGHTCGPFPQPE